MDSLIVAVGHNEFRDLDAKYHDRCAGAVPVLADVKSLYDRIPLSKEGFSVFRL